jgi:hypothetical protein
MGAGSKHGSWIGRRNTDTDWPARPWSSAGIRIRNSGPTSRGVFSFNLRICFRNSSRNNFTVSSRINCPFLTFPTSKLTQLFYPKTQERKARRLKSHFPNSAKCSGFYSGFEGDSIQFPTTWESRMKRRIKRNPLISFSGLKLNLNFKVVRAAGVEPTTFGSGGRRSIQLSYAREATPKIPARTALLKWNRWRFPTPN